MKTAKHAAVKHKKMLQVSVVLTILRHMNTWLITQNKMQIHNLW